MSSLDTIISELKKVASLSPTKPEHTMRDLEYLDTVNSIAEVVRNNENAIGKDCSPLSVFYSLDSIIENLSYAIESTQMVSSNLKLSYLHNLHSLKDKAVRSSLLKFSKQMQGCMADMLTDEYAPAWVKDYKKAVINYGFTPAMLRNADALENDDAVASCVEDPKKNFCGMVLNLDTCEIRGGDPHVTHQDYYDGENNGDWQHLWATSPGTGEYRISSSSRKWWNKELDRDEAIKIMVKVAECLCKHNKTGQELYYGGEIKKQFSRPSEVCLVDEKVARMLTRKADKEDKIADTMMAKLEDELAKTEAEYELAKGIVDEWKDELVGEKQ